MNFDVDIMKIVVEGIISIVVILLGRYIIPWVKQRFVTGWVVEAVKAAEQTYGSGSGSIKKDDVLEFLSEMLDRYKIKMTAKEIDILIEAAVKKLKIEQAQ